MGKSSGFLTKFDEIGKYVNQNNKLNGSENNNTAKLLIPFFETILNLESDFDEDDLEGNRPDLVLYLNKDLKESKSPSILIESKKPREFKSLSKDEIIEKYLEDKVVKYILANRFSSKYFIIHSFSYFICFKIDKLTLEYIDVFNNDKNKKNKTNLLEHLSSISKEFKFSISSKQARIQNINAFFSYLNANMSRESLLRQSEENYVNCNFLRGEKDLRVHAQLIAKYAGANKGDPGLFSEIWKFLSKELAKNTSQTKINYRLFLSTKHPEESVIDEIEKYDKPHEREIFCLSSMYSLIGKLFLTKYVQDCFSVGENPLIPSDQCFLKKPIATLDSIEALEWYKSESGKFSNNVPKSLEKLLTRNDFFDWFLNSACLKSDNLKNIIMEFQKIDFYESKNKYEFKGDISGSFYEIFTENFSKKTRQDLGQYYTPKPIVNFMWNRVCKLIEKEGLEYRDLKILDPACGSGTFVVEAVDKLWDEIGTDITQKLVAFDISPFSIGLAEINLYSTILEKTEEVDRKKIPPLVVFNTDSLDTESSEYWTKRIEEEGSEQRMRYLEDQKYISSELKNKKEYTVIVTNPPYNGSSKRNLKSFDDRFDLTTELIENFDKDNRIRDDYVWFMAAVDHYIDENGIVALITNDSYVNKRSYQTLRSYLFKNYNIHELYLFGEQMFDDVKVSTSVIVMSKFKNPEVIRNISSSHDVYDLRGLKTNVNNRECDERYQFLLGKKTIRPQRITPSEKNGFSFSTNDVLFDVIPITPSKKGAPGAIRDKESGVVSGCKELFFNTDDSKLITQMNELFEIGTHASFLYQDEIPENISNENVRNLGTNFLDKSEFKEVRRMMDEFASKWNIGMQKGSDKDEKVPLYVSFCVACIVLKKMSYNGELIRDCVTLASESKWTFDGSEKGFLYLDNRFSIPRVNMRSASNIQGGPRTSWGKDNDLFPKVCFTTPSGSKGVSRMIISDEKYNPVILKAVSRGGAEAHYVPLERLTIPSEFSSLFNSKLDYAYYLQGILNSNWIQENHDFVVTNKAPIPLPRKDNINKIVEVSTYSKILNELSKFKIFTVIAKKVNMKDLETRIGSEISSELSEYVGVKLDLNKFNSKIDSMIDATERELNSSVKELFSLHTKPESSEVDVKENIKVS